MPKSIKVAVITQADGAHLSDYLGSLAKIEEAEAVALADPSGKSVELARKALGDKLKAVYKDHNELLKRFEPHLAVDGDPDLGGLMGLAEQMHLVDGQPLVHLPATADGAHGERQSHVAQAHDADFGGAAGELVEQQVGEGRRQGRSVGHGSA